MGNNSLSRSETEYSRVPKGPPVASRADRSQWGKGAAEVCARQYVTQSRGSVYWSAISATTP